MPARLRPAAQVASALLLLAAAGRPAQAVDFVPFAGTRFGGYLDTTPASSTMTTSLPINGSVSYGGVLDLPLYGPRAVELYFSHQPTSLSPAGPVTQTIRDVTVDVMQVGLADSIASDDPRLTWLLIGTLGATRFATPGGTNIGPSLGLGGGMVWMANSHFGLRGDARAFLSFGSGGGGGAIACGGGCTVSIHSSVVPQGEFSLGLLFRF